MRPSTQANEGIDHDDRYAGVEEIRNLLRNYEKLKTSAARPMPQRVLEDVQRKVAGFRHRFAQMPRGTVQPYSKRGVLEDGREWEFEYSYIEVFSFNILENGSKPAHTGATIRTSPEMTALSSERSQVHRVMQPEVSTPQTLLRKARLLQGNVKDATEDEIRHAFLDAKQDPIGQDLIVKGLEEKKDLSAALVISLLEHAVSPAAGKGMVDLLAKWGAFPTIDMPQLKKLYTSVVLDPLSAYFAEQYDSFEVQDLQKELQKRNPSVPLVSWTIARVLATKMPQEEFVSYVTQHPALFGSDNQRTLILRTVVTH